MLSSVRAWVHTKKLILPMLLVAVLSISAVATATEVVRAQEQTKEKTIEKTVYVPADQSQNVSGGVLGGSSSWLWGLLGLLGLFGLLGLLGLRRGRNGGGGGTSSRQNATSSPQDARETPAPPGSVNEGADGLPKERVMEAIRAEWDKTRPSGGVGIADSKDVYERLIAEGVDVPQGAMGSILEKLHDEGRISGTPYHDPAGIPIHGAWSIIEPGWGRR